MVTGLLLALAAAAFFECSYVLQALGVREVPAMGRPGVAALRGLVVRPRWALGIVLGLVAFALQVLALRHAPLTFVQPVLASGLLLLLAFSVVVLHERVGPRQVAAVAGIIGGVTAIALADPARGHSTDSTAFAVAAVVLGAVASAAFLRRRPGVNVLLASAVASDALAALAAAEAARALPEVLPAAAWCLLAAAAGLSTLAAESTALQQRGASRVAPIVLAGQVAVPVALAPLLLGERWDHTASGLPLLIAGLVLVVISSAVLAASPGVSRLAVGAREGKDEVGGVR